MNRHQSGAERTHFFRPDCRTDRYITLCRFATAVRSRTGCPDRSLRRIKPFAGYCPQHNARFSVAPRDPPPLSSPSGAGIWIASSALESERVVARDNTVRIDNLLLQLAAQPGRRSCPGLHVTVREHLDGQYTVSQGARQLGHFTADGQPLSDRLVLKAAI